MNLKIALILIFMNFKTFCGGQEITTAFDGRMFKVEFEATIFKNNIAPPDFNTNKHEYNYFIKDGARIYWDVFHKDEFKINEYSYKKTFPIPFVLYDWNYICIPTDNEKIKIYGEKHPTNSTSETRNFIAFIEKDNLIFALSIYFANKSIEPCQYALNIINKIAMDCSKLSKYSEFNYPIQETTPKTVEEFSIYFENNASKEIKSIFKSILTKNNNLNKTSINQTSEIALDYIDYLVRALALDNNYSPLGAMFTKRSIGDPSKRAWMLIEYWLNDENNK